MDRRRWLRTSTAAFAALTILALSAIGSVPDGEASGAEIARWFGDHASNVRWAAVCVTFAFVAQAIVFTLVAPSLGWMARPFVVGMVAVGVLTAVQTWIYLALARRPDSLEPATARTLLDVSSYWGPLLIPFTLLTLGPLAWAGLRTRQLPTWVGGLALVAVVEQVVELVTVFGDTGFTEPGGAMNLYLGGGLTAASWVAAGATARAAQSE